MRLRLAHVMELIVGLAMGLAFVRFNGDDGPRGAMSILTYMNDIALDVIAGIAVVAGVSLLLESIRRWGHAGPWGVGRWFWGISATSFVAGGIGQALTMAFDQYLKYNEIQFANFLVDVSFAVAVHGATSDLIGFLLVMLLTALLARPPRGGESDYREWSGRIMGGLLIVWQAVVYIDTILHPDNWVVF